MSVQNDAEMIGWEACQSQLEERLGNYHVDCEPNELLVPRREEVKIPTTSYPVVREVIPVKAEGKSGMWSIPWQLRNL